MPAEIVTGSFCASYYATYTVPGSKPGTSYKVSHDGTSMAHCTCPSYQFSRDRSCKHIEYVFKHACMWNCQWFDGNPIVDLKPDALTYDAIIHGEVCPNCGGPVVAVKIAV